jgi:hypothetical protein
MMMMMMMMMLDARTLSVSLKVTMCFRRGANLAFHLSSFTITFIDHDRGIMMLSNALASMPETQEFVHRTESSIWRAKF